MRKEIKDIRRSFLIPTVLLIFIVLIKFSEEFLGQSFHFLGVYPLRAKGLLGILTSPLVHSDWGHIFANSVPFLALGTSLFYFYKGISFRVLGWIWILSSVFVWIAGRPSWHIGASGVNYGLFGFILLSAILRRRKDLIAVALAVVFYYGSMVWGVFPDFFPNQNISFEAHTGGLVAGLFLAIVYRKRGPQPIVYPWENEDDQLGEEFESLPIVNEKKVDENSDSPENKPQIIIKPKKWPQDNRTNVS